MILTYLAETMENSTVELRQISSRSISIPNNEAQASLLAYYWAAGNPAGQLDFFTIKKIVDMNPTNKDKSWLDQFCYSERPGHAVFDIDTENQEEIQDPELAAIKILGGLSDVQAFIRLRVEI